METIFQEIELALRARLYYAAICMSLSVPDVCAALLHPVGHVKGSNKAGYIKWYDQNLSALYPSVTGSDLYSLRNGVIHSGRFGLPGKQTFSRVLFTLPDRGGNTFHQIGIDDALNLDAIKFCTDITQVARVWLETHKDDGNLKRNMDKVVRLRPNGLAPYIVGPPLIA